MKTQKREAALRALVYGGPSCWIGIDFRIRTPRGRTLSLRQYLALVQAQVRNPYGSPDLPCEYGHFGCAAWEGGPCDSEVWGLAAELNPEWAKEQDPNLAEWIDS